VRALVLLSGGVDSTIMLHQALRKYDEVCAVFFDYGQTNVWAELQAAKEIAKRREVELHCLGIAGAVCGIPEETPKPGTSFGINRANMPARNMVLLASAASLAGALWSEPEACVLGKATNVCLLLGATFEDQGSFPDCRRAFQKAASAAVAAALDGVVMACVLFPLWRHSKGHLIKTATAEELEDIELAVSCYDANGPCHECDACRVRAKAFADARMEDAGVRG